MTTVSRDDILRLAQLSNVRLSDEEVTSLQHDIPTILSYVEQLNELDTTGVEPAYQVTGLHNVLRDDEVKTSSVSREQLLALTQESKDNQIKVPKVL